MSIPLGKHAACADCDRWARVVELAQRDGTRELRRLVNDLWMTHLRGIAIRAY